MTVYRDPRTKKWRYDFQVKGRRYTRAGFETKRDANRAQEDRRKVADTDLLLYPTFKDLVGNYLLTGEREKSAAWVKQEEQKLNRAFNSLEAIAPQKLLPGHFDRILNSLRAEGLKGTTVNEYRTIAHSVMQYAVRMGAIPTNPLDAVGKAPTEETEVVPIPGADLRRLILKAANEMAALLIFLAYTGARFIEASRLVWTEVILDRGPKPFCILTTRKRRGGGERKRPQPLLGEALRAIELMRGIDPVRVFPGPDGRVLAYRTALGRLHKLCTDLEMEHHSFHQIRHWAGTAAVGMGKSRKAVASFLGQTSTGATERYMHALDPELWEIAAHLERELALQMAAEKAAEVTGAK